MNFYAKFETFLDGLTMYRVVLYGLSLLVVYSFIVSALGLIAHSVQALFFSLVLLVGVSVLTHLVFKALFKAPAFIESSFITALILFFVVAPPETLSEKGLVMGVAFLAIASKYILSFRYKHIFNPVAIALVIVSVSGFLGGVWWIGSSVMFLPTLLVGLTVIKKLRRFAFFNTYVITSTVAVLIIQGLGGESLLGILRQHFFSWPTIFFASFMLSEPSTMPPRKSMQLAYAVFVGVVSSIPFHLGSFYSSPEFALCLGNVGTFLLSSKGRVRLVLTERVQLAEGIFEFIFKKQGPLSYLPGQYIEWTLLHKNPDLRGARRYFTIASSPSDSLVRLGVRIFEKGSTFKQKLMSLSPGDALYATSVSGDFVLPEDKNQKLVFIAGGIGVTPFMSMARTLKLLGEKRDIVLLYAARNEQSLAYKEELESMAQAIGMKLVYVLNEAGSYANTPGYRTGMITGDMVREEVTEVGERIFYISGPQVMVVAYTKVLRDIGVPDSHIMRDYFPGFA